MSVEGLQKIKKIVDNTGVKVESVCADYFMESPLFRNRELSKSIETLIKLIKNVSFLGVNNIIIPCVDNSRFQSDSDKLEFIENMIQPLSYAQEYKVNLSLETDLNPLNFARLLDKFSSEYLTVNYDVGNSASLGYDSTEEFRAYGDRISDIHIKDRLLNGSSVLLGTGNADFNKFFKLLEKLDYSGPLIMQAYRDDDALDGFLSQYDWIKQRLAELYES
jgi:sugar phosphate isomerase/epimerase